LILRGHGKFSQVRDTNHFITWFVYFQVYFEDNQLILWRGRGAQEDFVNKINNMGWTE
jgi:hypothetical protein